MKLTALELSVIVDALRGSLAIKDNGVLFNYTQETRELVMKHILDIMRTTVVQVENTGE